MTEGSLMSPQDDAQTRERRWWVERWFGERSEEGQYARGRVLCSPRRDDGGRDLFRYTRAVEVGDVCVHMHEDGIVGISRVASPYEEVEPLDAPPDFPRWNDSTHHLVRLEGYRPLDPPLRRPGIFTEEFRERLVSASSEAKKDGDYLFFSENLRPIGYVTPAPPALVDVLDEAYRKVSGRTLREVVEEEGATASSARWDTFIEWAKRFYEWELFDEWERDYKLKIAANLKAAKDALLEGSPDWGEKLRTAFGPPNNLTSWRVHAPFLDLLNSNREGLEEALRQLWETDAGAPPQERVRGFANRVREIGFQQGLDSLASFLLMAANVEEHPIYRATPFNEAYRLTGYPTPESGSESWERYGHALGFVDEFIARANARGLPIQDRLDAQSLIWCVTSKTPEEWPQRVTDAHDAYRKDGAPPPPEDPWTTGKVAKLAKELLWQPGDLQKIIDGLKDKRQVILQGPPGTGKTYVAKRIAEWCKEHGGDYRIVQFHPSYAYEDFIEGFRPRLTEGGQAGFTLTEGPLRRIAEQARAKPDATFILVIDEINRGNLSKVLGELYFLLEYRDEEVALQYSNEPFSLPKNLWFIGTMNTTDRSIALVDAALRRRFYFFNFFPDQPPVEGLLSRWIAENDPEAEWVAKLVDKANEKLEDRHLGIGPSHFMKKGTPLDEGRVRFIWEQAIITHIEEQYFGDEKRLKDFAFDRLKGELDGGPAEPAADGDVTEGAAGDENEQSEQADA